MKLINIVRFFLHFDKFAFFSFLFFSAIHINTFSSLGLPRSTQHHKKKFHYLVIYVISYTLYLLHFRFVTVSDYYWIDLLPNTGTACFIANSLFSFLKMYVYLKSVYIDILINILVLQ